MPASYARQRPFELPRLLPATRPQNLPSRVPVCASLGTRASLQVRTAPNIVTLDENPERFAGRQRTESRRMTLGADSVALGSVASAVLRKHVSRTRLGSPAAEGRTARLRTEAQKTDAAWLCNAHCDLARSGAFELRLTAAPADQWKLARAEQGSNVQGERQTTALRPPQGRSANEPRRWLSA